MTRIAALSRTDMHTTHDLSVRDGMGKGKETEPHDWVSCGREGYTNSWR
jgi:hypothetical protein